MSQLRPLAESTTGLERGAHVERVKNARHTIDMAVQNHLTGRPILQNAERLVEPRGRSPWTSNELVELLEKGLYRFQSLEVDRSRLRARPATPPMQSRFAGIQRLRQIRVTEPELLVQSTPCVSLIEITIHCTMQPHDGELALIRAWTRLGAAFTVEPEREPVDLEAVIAQTAGVAPRNERLFVMAATWLAGRHTLVDARRLVAALKPLRGKSSAVAGALLSVAAESTTGQTALHAGLVVCHKLRRAEPLFDVMRTHPKLLALVRQEALAVYLWWGLWHNDARLAWDALRPVRWTLDHCPELRFRALLGSGLDAGVAGVLAGQPATITELAASTGATYAATHVAATRLAARGLLDPPSDDSRPKRWRVSPALVRATNVAFRR